jgi:hypothetical protein
MKKYNLNFNTWKTAKGEHHDQVDNISLDIFRPILAQFSGLGHIGQCPMGCPAALQQASWIFQIPQEQLPE